VAKLRSFRELRVYQELRRLHLEVHRESLEFPKFELYELGSQVHRSSNSAPAILAEGWGSRHTNVYIEAVNRTTGEVRETQHHLDVARAKGYLTGERFRELDGAYESCGRMLERLHHALSGWRNTTRTGSEVHEQQAIYIASGSAPDWDNVVTITQEIMQDSRCPPSASPNTQHPTPNTSC